VSGFADEQAAPMRPRDYKSDVHPVWCPGCGDFGVLSALTKTFAAEELPPERIALVSGIGCSSRLPAYLHAYGFHGVHGRVLPLATGLAVARPDLTVIAMGGDGDGFSIGGNHFLHACRRNVDFTYIVMDNAVYGMTKGQASPTTESDWTGSKLTPEGTHLHPIQPLEIALSAGCTFIAREFSGNSNGLAKRVAEAIAHPGFAFIQVIAPCITYRPEQMGYKKRVQAGFEATGSRRDAFAQLFDAGPLTTGLLFRAELPPWQPDPRADEPVDALEAAFVIQRSG
jgi:2-oxoglutarate ferredoxin oxidoreductase subunit beta